jgi:ubiquinone/menaquinone biosynthesis C-methylase UbiE
VLIESYNQSKIWDRALNDLAHIDYYPENELKTFLNKLKILSEINGLEIGCGLGRHSLAALEMGFRMTSIDFSEAAVVQTGKIIKNSRHNGNVIKASMEHLPFKDGVFDFSFSWCVLNHGTEKTLRNAVKESLRVVKTKGYSFGFIISNKDSRYGKGEKVFTDCFVFDEGIEAGICHYFPSIEKIRGLFEKDANILEMKEVIEVGENIKKYHPINTQSCHIIYFVKKY